MDLVVSEISKQIYTVRGVRVMLDSDLARLFQTETRVLNQTVRRNMDRFPEDFMFQLSKEEFEVLISQIVISKKEARGGRQKLPWVFTDLGVGMLSSILSNARSIQVSITVFRAFGQMRQTTQAKFETELNQFRQVSTRLERKLDYYFGRTDQTNSKIHEESGDSRLSFSDPKLEKRVKKIQKQVARHFGLTVSELTAVTRVKTIAMPRQIAIYLVRKNTQMGFKEIGKYFGGKDHTTILHAYRKIEEELMTNSSIQEAISECGVGIR